VPHFLPGVETCWRDFRAARAPETANEARRYGFVTEIKLEDGSEVRVASGEESAKSGEEG